ncbi:hypothetical protein [Microbacterium sp. CJ88]|uniref:hypothetical protein n=1 Tax=Microbacterium sp. CJ88 TaxID=3445672 RepID=UPI003F6606E6
MSGGAAPEGGPVRPAVALAIGVVSYVALAIFGFGMTSLLIDRDVIDVQGLGQVAGIIGMVLSAGLLALVLWGALRLPRPPYAASVVGALAAYVGYLAGVLGGALASGVDPLAALAAVGGVAVSWFGVVLAAAGFIAAWGAIALARTRAGRPRWPWEDDEDE